VLPPVVCVCSPGAPLLEALDRAQHLAGIDAQDHRGDYRDDDCAAAKLAAAAARKPSTPAASADANIGGIELSESHPVVSSSLRLCDESTIRQRAYAV